MDINIISLINISSSIIFLTCIYVRYLKSFKTINISDPYYLFLGFAFLYSIVGQYNKIPLDKFSDLVYLDSSLIAFLFFFSFLIFSLFNKPSKQYDPRIISQFYMYRRLFFISGLISLAVGYLFFYLNYSRLGNFYEIMLSFENRVNRNAALTELRGNLPFTHFLFAGAMLILASFLSAKRSIRRSLSLTFIFIAPLFLFYIVDGERTAILKYLIAGFFVCVAFSIRKKLTLKPKYVVSLIALFMAFSFLGNMRAFIGLAIFTGDFKPIEQRLKGGYGDTGLALFIPSEFPAINYTLNRSVYQFQENGSVLKYGASYLNGVPYLFPRSVYDKFGLKKSPTIADELGEKVRLEIGRKRKVGFGMSPLAEAFTNFGFFGSVIFSFFIVIWINLIVKLLYSGSPLLILWSCMQAPTLFMINRSAFSSVFSTIIWVSLIFFCAYMAALFIDYLVPKKSQEYL